MKFNHRKFSIETFGDKKYEFNLALKLTNKKQQIPESHGLAHVDKYGKMEHFQWIQFPSLPFLLPKRTIYHDCINNNTLIYHSRFPINGT